MLSFRTLTAVVAAAMMSLSALGLAIQFDFGNVVGSYNGAIAPAYEADAQELNSQRDGGTPILITNLGGHGLLDSQKDGTTWNNVPDGGTFGSLVDVNGVSVVGVTATVAGAKSSTSLGDWSGKPLGDTSWGWACSDEGVQSTTLMQDEITMQGAGEHDATLVGFRITGLDPGTYTVFVMGATVYAENRVRDVKIGVGDASLSLYGDFVPSFEGSTGVGGRQNEPAWAEGQNYVWTTVTTTDKSDYIVVMVHGPYAAFSGIQIIQEVPEPATMSLLALGGLALLRRRR